MLSTGLLSECAISKGQPGKLGITICSFSVSSVCSVLVVTFNGLKVSEIAEDEHSGSVLFCLNYQFYISILMQLHRIYKQNCTIHEHYLSLISPAVLMQS